MTIVSDMQARQYRNKNIKLRANVLGIFALIFASTFGMVSPEVVYADEHCDITVGSGQDYADIQSAIDAAAEGGVICVEAGEYSGFNINKDGISILGSNASISSGHEQIVISGNNVQLEGFTIDGPYNNFPAHNPEATPGLVMLGIILVTGDNATVTGNTVSPSLIHAQPSALTVTGANTHIHGNVFEFPENIHEQPILELSPTANNAVIENNTFNRYLGGIVGENQEILIQNNTYTEDVENIGFSGINWGPIPESANINVLEAEFPIIVDQSNQKNGWYRAVRNIQLGLGELVSGGTLAVPAGTYEETLDIDVDDITLQSQDGPEATTIVANTTREEGVVGINANGVTLEGFTIDNVSSELNNRAVRVNDSTTNTTIANNILVNSFRGVQGNWSSGGYNLTVTGNTFNTSYGVAGTEDMSGLVIDNNTFNTSEEGIGIGAGVAIESITGNHFAGSNEHVRIYDTAVELAYLDDLLGSNTFDRSSVIRNNDGDIISPAIFATAQKVVNDDLFDADEGSDLGNTTEVTTKVEISINSSKGATTSKVTMGPNTKITKDDGTAFDATQIGANIEDATEFTVENAETKAVLQWGIPGVTLNFSPAITIEIFVGTDLAGQTLQIRRSTNGDDWTDDGLKNPAECTVDSEGICSFTTTKASYFAVYQEEVAEEEEKEEEKEEAEDTTGEALTPPIVQTAVATTTTTEADATEEAEEEVDESEVSITETEDENGEVAAAEDDQTALWWWLIPIAILAMAFYFNRRRGSDKPELMDS